MRIFRSFPPTGKLSLLPVIFSIVWGLSFFPYRANLGHGADIPPQGGGKPQVFLESFFKNKDIYEEAFAPTHNLKKTRIRAGIVSHHFLAKDLIAAFFAGIDGREVQRIILIGPDHYKSYYSNRFVFSSLLTWKTPFGFMEPDRPCIRQLVAAHECSLRDGLFIQEHSIHTLVPFISKALPHVKIVPLILRNHGNYAQFRQLGAGLRQSDPEGTVLIVSSDFAHGVNQETAARLDAASIANLKNLHGENINKISCDFRPGLATLWGFLGERGGTFSLVNHKTSLDYGSKDPNNLTSYITAYYQDTPSPSISLLLVGDLMFDRYIRKVADSKGSDYIFQEIAQVLRENNVVIANLEGPITDQPSMSLNTVRGDKNNYIFTSDPGLAPTLKKHNITVVNLGNNHILDFDREGLRQTRNYLDLAGVSYFGDPADAEKRWAIKNIGGIRVGLVSHNLFIPGSTDRTLDDIRDVKENSDITLVYAHWGHEYSQDPGHRIRKLARAFIDRGADLVVGSHPHVVQEKEVYQGKMIYYSLGNFVFDQYHNQDTRRGLAVQVKIDSRNFSMSLEEISLSLEKNGQTTIKNTINQD